MAVLSTSTKGKAGVKVAKAAIKNPGAVGLGVKATRPVAKVGFKAGKPLAKRKLRKRAGQVSDAARSLGEVLTVYAPQAAYDWGLAEPPKPKRTAPRVLIGIVIGAGAMYLLEAEGGRDLRHKVTELVS